MKESECVCGTGKAEIRIEGDFVYFGIYPQSLKSENVTVGTAADENGYYTGNDGGKYAKKEDAYYKVEPIKWRILQRENDTALVLSEWILDAKPFDASNNYYAKSGIRRWLNGEFYQKAFCALEKERIITTDVENGLGSTGDEENPYICENTQDNVFLLSYREAFESFSLTNADRRKKATPYAAKPDLYVNPYHHHSYWWLRSPYPECCDRDGIIEQRARMTHQLGFASFCVTSLIEGVVPALRIGL